MEQSQFLTRCCSELGKRKCSELEYHKLMATFKSYYMDEANRAPKRDSRGLYWSNALGEFHRTFDLPAIVADDGTLYWYRNNKLSRDRGLPVIIERREGFRAFYWIRDKDSALPYYMDTDGNRAWHGKKINADGGLIF